jgi:hypothetical protein
MDLIQLAFKIAYLEMYELPLGPIPSVLQVPESSYHKSQVKYGSKMINLVSSITDIDFLCASVLWREPG